MTVEFLSNRNPYGKWCCIATKNLTTIPQVGTVIKITVPIRGGGSRKLDYTIKCIEFDADIPKYTIYLL